MQDVFQRHLAEASAHEQSYLQKEPTFATTRKLLEVLEESGLSVHDAKGCLEFTKFLTEFSKVCTDL